MAIPGLGKLLAAATGCDDEEEIRPDEMLGRDAGLRFDTVRTELLPE